MSDNRRLPPPQTAEDPFDLVDPKAIQTLLKCKEEGRVPTMADMRHLVPKDVWGHPDQSKPRFRNIPPRARYTFPIISAILLELAKGSTENHASRSIGIDPKQLSSWKKSRPALVGAVETAKAIAVTSYADVVHRVAMGDSKDNWKASVAFLRMRGGQEWSEHRTQEVNGSITHEHGLIEKIRDVQAKRIEADRAALDSESSTRKLETPANQGVIDAEVIDVPKTVTNQTKKTNEQDQIN